VAQFALLFTPKHVSTVTTSMCGAAQQDFAKTICELTPAKAKGWSKLLGEAASIFEKGLTTASAERLARAVTALENILIPLHKEVESYTIHAVDHAHIDMTWIFSWQETVATTCDTMTTVLKLMEEFPEDKFSQDQGSIYKIRAQYQPGLLDMIRAQIARSHR